MSVEWLDIFVTKPDASGFCGVGRNAKFYGGKTGWQVLFRCYFSSRSINIDTGWRRSYYINPESYYVGAVGEAVPCPATEEDCIVTIVIQGEFGANRELKFVSSTRFSVTLPARPTKQVDQASLTYTATASSSSGGSYQFEGKDYTNYEAKAEAGSTDKPAEPQPSTLHVATETEPAKPTYSSPATTTEDKFKQLWWMIRKWILSVLRQTTV